MSSVVLNPLSTEVGGLEEMLPLLSSPRPKPIDSGCTEASPWVRLRESKFLSPRKRQRNGNTYPTCQTATLPHKLLPLSSHPWKVPFFTIKENHQQIQVTKTKHLGPQYHFLHRLLKRQNVQSLEVFQEQGSSFLANPTLLTRTGEAWLTWQECFDSSPLSVWS